MSRSQTLLKNTLYISISKLVTEVIGIFVQILVIRKLSVEIFGTFNFLLNSFVIFQIFSISPISDVFYRYIAEFSEKNDYKRLRKLIQYGTFISLVSFLLLLLLLHLFKYDFSRIFSINDLDQYYQSYILFLCCFYLSTVTSLITASLLLHKNLGIIRIITSIVRSVLYLITINNLTVNKLITIESIVSFISFVYLSFILIKKIVKKESEDKISFYNGKRRVFRFGVFSSLNQLGTGIIGKSSDYFIISAIGDPLSVGLYAFAHKIHGIIFKILPMKDFFSVVRTVFFQKFAKKKSEIEINTYYNLMVKVMLPIYIFPFLIFTIFGKSIITYIFDPKYLASYYTTCIVLLSLVITAIFYPLGLVVQLYEKPEYGFYSKIVVIFSIVAGIYSMKFWGIVGVASATFVGELLRNIIMLCLLRKIIKIKYKYMDILNYFIPIGILSIVFYLFYNSIDNIIILIFMMLIYFVVYVILTILYNPFNNDELIIMNNVISKSNSLVKIKDVVLKINSIKKVF